MWTTFDSCTCLSTSDSKQYIDFEFCEEKDHMHFKHILIYKALSSYVDKNNLKRIYLFLEDNASGCASGDIEQIIIKSLIKS